MSGQTFGRSPDGRVLRVRSAGTLHKAGDVQPVYIHYVEGKRQLRQVPVGTLPPQKASLAPKPASSGGKKTPKSSLSRARGDAARLQVHKEVVRDGKTSGRPLESVDGNWTLKSSSLLKSDEALLKNLAARNKAVSQSISSQTPEKKPMQQEVARVQVHNSSMANGGVPRSPVAMDGGTVLYRSQPHAVADPGDGIKVETTYQPATLLLSPQSPGPPSPFQSAPGAPFTLVSPYNRDLRDSREKSSSVPNLLKNVPLSLSPAYHEDPGLPIQTLPRNFGQQKAGASANHYEVSTVPRNWGHKEMVYSGKMVKVQVPAYEITEHANVDQLMIKRQQQQQQYLSASGVKDVSGGAFLWSVPMLEYSVIVSVQWVTSCEIAPSARERRLQY